MTSNVLVWILGASSIIISLFGSGYFIMCLNPDLMKDYIIIWALLLTMGISSVIEVIYFITGLVLFIMQNKTLGLTLGSIVRLFDPLLQVLATSGLLVSVIIFNPSGGNDDGIFQLIVILAMSTVKIFITYTTMIFLYDYNSHKNTAVELSDSNRPYTFVPSKDNETVESEKVAKPIFLVPAQGIMPIYVMNN